MLGLLESWVVGGVYFGERVWDVGSACFIGATGQRRVVVRAISSGTAKVKVTEQCGQNTWAHDQQPSSESVPTCSDSMVPRDDKTTRGHHLVTA